MLPCGAAEAVTVGGGSAPLQTLLREEALEAIPLGVSVVVCVSATTTVGRGLLPLLWEEGSLGEYELPRVTAVEIGEVWGLESFRAFFKGVTLELCSLDDSAGGRGPRASALTCGSATLPGRSDLLPRLLDGGLNWLSEPSLRVSAATLEAEVLLSSLWSFLGRLPLPPPEPAALTFGLADICPQVLRSLKRLTEG